jgi:hypothetical protein
VKLVHAPTYPEIHELKHAKDRVIEPDTQAFGDRFVYKHHRGVKDQVDRKGLSRSSLDNEQRDAMGEEPEDE